MLAVLALLATATSSQEVEFRYEDLTHFATAIEKHGDDYAKASKAYVDGAGPGFRAFAKAYGTNPESIQAQIEKRPLYYKSLPSTLSQLKALEPDLRTSISKLQKLSGGKQTVPVFYLVADLKAGGTPKEVEGTPPPGFGILVALEMMSVRPETNMAEFPNYRGVPLATDSVHQIVVHEMAHVFQVQHQGINEYRSIYTPDGYNTNLAILIREGAAEFLTHMAAGRRLGNRHLWGAQNEKRLWQEFDQIKYEKAFQTPGWFDGGGKPEPDRPMQIGYWLGMRVCEEFYHAAQDKDAALKALFSANKKEQFEEILKPYAARMKA
jgi:hypothetical protein